MNRAARFAVAIGVGFTAVEAQAGSVTVTFGALPNAVAIESYYNGGLSGHPPAGKGPDLSLVFSSLANEQKATTTNPPPRPGTGKFENNPSGAAAILLSAMEFTPWQEITRRQDRSRPRPLRLSF